MAAVDCTPSSGYMKSHNRILSKSSNPSQNPQSRRKTAAERLEADKLKYVKSSKARQRRFTLELHSTSPHNDSTGTHSMGTASTGSPINMDDDDTSDYTGCNDFSRDNIHRSHSNGTFYTGLQQNNRPVVRSSTDTDFTRNSVSAQQTRATVSTVVVPQRTKTYISQAEHTPKTKTTETVVTSSKGAHRTKSFSNYLNKAKEGLKAVTSTISGSNNDENVVPRSRESRSVTTKGSKYRSASVGANVYRNRDVAPRNTDKTAVNRTVSENPVMSPRSQLKHARQNLKKVNNKPKYERNTTVRGRTQDENSATFASPSARPKANTFTVVPRARRNVAKTMEDPVQTGTDKQQATSEGKPSTPSKPTYLRGRPLSVIENGGAQSKYLQEKMTTLEQTNREHQRGVVRRRSSSSKEDDPGSFGNDVDITMDAQTEAQKVGAGIRRRSSQLIKRRSWDLAHTMDTSLQLAMNKSTAPTSLTPDPDMVLTTPLANLPRQRKSWSRAPNENRKSNRVSYHEEGCYSKPGVRKSITEALEEIFTPLTQDDPTLLVVSPDAATESRTLVGQSTFHPERSIENSVADNINHILRGSDSIGDVGTSTRSRSPESSRSKTPTGNPGVGYYGGNDVDIGVAVSKYPPSSTYSKSKSSANSSPGSMHRRQSKYSESGATAEPVYPDARWTDHDDNRVVSTQPLNRIDQAPTSSLQAGIPNSPMLAPRSRREVAPDYGVRNNSNSLSRTDNEEPISNTLKSHNTSSSASFDVAKPFTALTASDLKPRKLKHPYVNPTMPLKPTYPYPMQAANGRGNPKRHTNAPVSPTMSPHKQQARMTPPHSSRSASSTPYSSLKRTPTSSRSSSLKRNRQRSKSDVSMVQNELDRFFSSMGMGEMVTSPYPNSADTLFTTALVSSESDFSFAGASAYVRDGPDETVPMEIDPMTASLSQVPSVSIIEKNARIMRWLNTCRKSSLAPSASNSSSSSAANPPRSPRIPVTVPHKDAVASGNGASALPPKPRHVLRSYSVETPVHHRHHPTSSSPHLKCPRSMPYISSPPPPIPPRVGLPKESDV